MRHNRIFVFFLFSDTFNPHTTKQNNCPPTADTQTRTQWKLSYTHHLHPQPLDHLQLINRLSNSQIPSKYLSCFTTIDYYFSAILYFRSNKSAWRWASAEEISPCTHTHSSMIIHYETKQSLIHPPLTQTHITHTHTYTHIQKCHHKKAKLLYLFYGRFTVCLVMFESWD